MQTLKELQAFGRSLLLDADNYGYWKVKVMNLIKGIDEDAWITVQKGWTIPKVIIDGVETLKPSEQWTVNEKKASALNSKALSIIFNTVDSDEFKQIQACKTAKEAWDALELIHEGTSSVKRKRRDIVKHQFDKLEMDEDESVKEFCGKLSALANEAAALGKQYKDSKLVNKLIMSLPEKYIPQIAAFQMVHNTDNVSFKETVGIFAAHELELNVIRKKSVPPRKKGVALHVPEDDSLHITAEDDMSLIVKKFNKFFKKKTSYPQKQEAKETNRCLECKGKGHWKANCPSVAKREAVLKSLQEIQCYECQGYGHTKKECLGKSKGKGKVIVNHDNSETESEEEEEEELPNLCAFIGIIDEESDDEEVDVNELYNETMKIYEINMRLVKEKKELELQLKEAKTEIVVKKEEITHLKQQLEETKKNVRMLGSGTEKLDYLLGMGRHDPGHTGLGYVGEQNKNQGKFVSGGILGEEVPDKIRRDPHFRPDFQPMYSRPDFHTRHYQPNFQSRRTYQERRSCFFCGKKGHIRAHCHHLKATRDKGKYNHYPFTVKQIWVRKDALNCNVALISEQSNHDNIWYLDSGCSRHMTGKKELLSNLGLKANLISISQLCDNGMKGNEQQTTVIPGQKRTKISQSASKEQVDKKHLAIEYVPTEHQLADLFTKPLDMNRFMCFQKSVGVGEQ
ncbi:PREDICTED: uncharacterized protein LOC104825183 [Tarenaya hassleriana]|uniref:uncharacterized protein LOC104825183 n=1 Tax=Tarenaya hassleriana TaxID=28532 RepID=UPI00053C53FD|nr:PREDICTED: uncharacterized protein LOC104825183 [Tarenaya hassleriana]